jgi:cytosine/adenosine deaminase-related metal-dependent hydrolase
VDCHVVNGSSILQQTRTGLLFKRRKHNTELAERGKYPKILPGDAVQAFNLATIQGARACNMEDQIGCLAVGKKADVVVFDAGTPSMLCATEQDPVVAVLRFSDVRDIDMVIVDGVIRKEGGKLTDVDAEGESVRWEEVAKEVKISREEVQVRLDGLDVERGKELLVGM